MRKTVLTLLLMSTLPAFSQSGGNAGGECPFGHGASSETSDNHISSKSKIEENHETSNRPNQNSDWWPNSLDLSPLRLQSEQTNPMHTDFNYEAAFNSLDYAALKSDIKDVLHTSKDWWPADWGHYGGLFIRMAWHSAGTYRTADGRGGSRDGMQRFAPLNSWPDNANLDKARRLLWPVKQKYGNKISWADLMVLAGNVALEDMGFETIGFAGGREDIWEPNKNVYWGMEKEWLGNNERYNEEGELETPLAAVQMGLIYVNPEGPNGEPDPVKAAHDIRISFLRMGMNDEETVALIAGGHTLGKTHGAASGDHLGAAPEGASFEEQGLGWKSDYKSGKGADAITSGLEVIWTRTPTEWSHDFFKALFQFEWELTKSPGGAHQWVAKGADAVIPDAFDSTKFHRPTMLTTDLSLRFDPEYEKISRRFLENPEEFEAAFARAWFKLTHRDMGPKSTYLGPEVPTEEFIWQDPIPAVDHELINGDDIGELKARIKKSGLTTSELISTAWASASTYRHSDRRGGANGARIQLAPMRNWEVNNPTQLNRVLSVYEKLQSDFNSKSDKVKISMADLIVLGGNLGVELAAEKAGYSVTIPFIPGRMDATQENTDIESVALLEPMADGFRNYEKARYKLSPEQLLVDKAQLLRLNAPEMVVLLGGMRVLETNFDNSNKGQLTPTPGALNNAFFVQLLDMNIVWKVSSESRETFKGYDRETNKLLYEASRVDLVIGANSELRAIAEVYASDDAKERFVQDFVKVWHKIMMLDRFDI